VTQDAFVSLVERWGRPLASLETATLLHQVVTCLAIDRLRKRSRWAGQSLSAWDAPDTALEREPSHKGDQGRIDAAWDLALLTRGESPRTLSVAVLHFVEGHSLTEVGVLLDLSPKTVRHLLQRFVDRARKRSGRLERKTQNSRDTQKPRNKSPDLRASGDPSPAVQNQPWSDGARVKRSLMQLLLCVMAVPMFSACGPDAERDFTPAAAPDTSTQVEALNAAAGEDVLRDGPRTPTRLVQATTAIGPSDPDVRDLGPAR
jgi:RNA polymerase sigma-70 factor (ECF subfamily)